MIEAPLSICVSPEIDKDKFAIAYQAGDDFVVRYDGELDNLADTWVTTGIIRQIEVSGGKTYLVINKDDLERFIDDTEWDYDVSG